MSGEATYRTLAGAAELREFTVGLLATRAGVNPATVRTVLNRHRHLFERAVGASGRRGGQPQVWSVREGAQEDLAAAVATVSGGFQDSKKAAEESADAGSALRLRPEDVNPEWVTADDLHAYPLQSERAAQGLLPQLVRMLLAATPGVTAVTMRTGDGIRLPGLDGQADASVATPQVPAGISVWELGTSRDPRGKAQQDYSKRTGELGQAERAEATYVAVSMRRFPDGKKWAAKRKTEGAWRDVWALDADDLHAWLEASPAVRLWVSERMGLRPAEVKTLYQWWGEWLGQMRPVIPAEFVLAGRTAQADELRATLRRGGEVVCIHAGSREEATAFAAAALEDPDGNDSIGLAASGAWSGERDRLVQVLRVSTAQEWARLVGAGGSLVLIPDFDDPDVGAAIHARHSVLVPLGAGDDQSRATIRLPRLARDDAREVLQRHGWDLEKADRAAVQARRSLPSFRRMLAIVPNRVKPAWVDSADMLAPLVLMGGWSAASNPDREIVAAVTDRPYGEVERELQRWAASDDSPFLLSGGNWLLSAAQDAWSLLSHALTTPDLDRWEQAALKVLTESDPTLTLPPSDRVFAGIRGVRRAYSPALRAGLARGAALLAAAPDNRPRTDQRTWADYAESLVAKLLTDSSDGSRWSSLADVLPLLAEAAPLAFLRAAAAGCSGSEPTLRAMFADSDSNLGWGTSSPHTGLLWALESLCWSARYAPEACDVLARLADIDPGGRLANRPARSLRHVLLPWYPQTAATQESRLEIIEGILRRRPEVGWQLLLSLLPQRFDMSDPTNSPLFRDDWKTAAPAVTLPEVIAATSTLITYVLQALRDNPRRWAEFAAGMDNLPHSELGRCLDPLAESDPATFDEPTRFDVWTELTRTISQHRGSPGADWAMPASLLGRLEEIAARWEPASAERYAQLFSWHPDLPGTDRSGPDFQDALARARERAIQEALADSHGGALFELIAKSPEPQLVGDALAAATGDEQAEMMLSKLGEAGPAGRAARGWVSRMSALGGSEWVGRTLGQADQLPQPARLAFYLALPPTSETWTAISAEPSDVADLYWQQVAVWVTRPDEIPVFVAHLLEHHRPWSAIDALTQQLHLSAKEVPVPLVVHALTAAYEPDAADVPQAGTAEYAVGVLLDHLENRVEDQILVQLEWQFFTVLEHHRDPRTLYKALAQEPQLFVDLVCTAFRAEGEPRTEIDAPTAARARQSFALLSHWRRPPGTGDDGSINEEFLRSWISQARNALNEKGRAKIGDHYIGQVLSGSPPGSDGMWPAEPIRDILEELPSPKLADGIAIGKYNGPGITIRRTYDGGRTEAALAKQYGAWSRAVMVRWPETGRMLRDMAREYHALAQRFDAEAERWADSG